MEVNMKNDLFLFEKRTAFLNRNNKKGLMKRLKYLFLPVIFLTLNLLSTVKAQDVERTMPTWWWGASVAANLNRYDGTTQMLNSSMTTPVAFHDARGVAPYGSLFAEYQKSKMWGLMLNVAYDGRWASFTHTTVPPDNHHAELSTMMSYLSIEPSFKFMPFKQGFYLFLGPEVNFNVDKQFRYENEDTRANTKADISSVRNTIVSAQLGAGYDFLVSSRTNNTWVELSPFISYQSNFGTEIRYGQDLDLMTARAGVAVKFGRSKEMVKPVVQEVPPVVIPEKEVKFSVVSPGTINMKRNVKETFPLRNYIFFDNNSTTIPSRYATITKEEAPGFRENQLLNLATADVTGPLTQQLNVYYNILNIIGSRMRDNAGSTIMLIGSNSMGAAQGNQLAMEVKNYLVNTFAIDGSRIMTEGRVKPLVPSEEAGFMAYIDEQRVEDNRVDITSTSPGLLMEAGTSDSTLMNPVQLVTVQEDPMDNNVVFDADGATEALNSWNIEITDQNGKMQTYGPYMQDKVNLSGKTILGDAYQGNYTVTMVGQTKSGKEVRKVSTMSLVRKDETETGLRFSILFDFDKYVTVGTYKDFLSNVVAPLIPDSGKVIIQGHTDIIGQKDYNQKLSENRADEVKNILMTCTLKDGKKSVDYTTYGFGQDETKAPFANKLPEERCYNRTVIIDIIPKE